MQPLFWVHDIRDLLRDRFSELHASSIPGLDWFSSSTKNLATSDYLRIVFRRENWFPSLQSLTASVYDDRLLRSIPRPTVAVDNTVLLLDFKTASKRREFYVDWSTTGYLLSEVRFSCSFVSESVFGGPLWTDLFRIQEILLSRPLSTVTLHLCLFAGELFW